MKRFFSAVLLCAATVSSIATSTEEDYPAIADGPSDLAMARYETNDWVAPGQTVQRSFVLSIPTADLGEVTDSHVSLHSTARTDNGWSDVAGVLESASSAASFELFADVANPYTEHVSLPNAFAGCVVSGDRCFAQYSFEYSHTSGSETVELDISLVGVTEGPNTNIEFDAL